MKEAEQTIRLGDYQIDFAEGGLKVINTHNKNGIAIVPSSGSGHVEDINSTDRNNTLTPCRLCNGRGKLMARVTVDWLANDETLIV